MRKGSNEHTIETPAKTSTFCGVSLFMTIPNLRQETSETHSVPHLSKEEHGKRQDLSRDACKRRKNVEKPDSK